MWNSVKYKQHWGKECSLGRPGKQLIPPFWLSEFHIKRRFCYRSTQLSCCTNEVYLNCHNHRKKLNLYITTLGNPLLRNETTAALVWIPQKCFSLPHFFSGSDNCIKGLRFIYLGRYLSKNFAMKPKKHKVFMQLLLLLINNQCRDVFPIKSAWNSNAISSCFNYFVLPLFLCLK